MISSNHADSDELTAYFTRREWVFHKIDHWLNADDKPSFLLRGGPGTGKSTIAARLVEMADGTVDSTIEGLGDALIYYHFCHARDPRSLEPRRFIEGLSLALCSRHEVCAKVTAEQAADVEINVIVDNVSADSVRGVVINRLFVSEGLDLNVAFDRIVRRPVEALRESGVQTPLLVLIDSLDEAISLGGEQHIPWMIERVMSGADGGRPEGMRLIITSRRQTAAIRHVGDAKRCDLILDAPDDVNDLRAYVARRLVAIPDARRQQLATEISKAGKGNFLYGCESRMAVMSAAWFVEFRQRLPWLLHVD